MNFEDEDLFEEFSVLDEYNENIFQEAKLNTEKRNELPSSEFGIPEKRAFPLNDKAHVEAAVRMFPHADDEYKEQLAQRILVKAKKLGMDTSGWDSLNKYVNECDMTVVEQSADKHLKQESVTPDNSYPDNATTRIDTSKLPQEFLDGINSENYQNLVKDINESMVPYYVKPIHEKLTDQSDDQDYWISTVRRLCSIDEMHYTADDYDFGPESQELQKGLIWIGYMSGDVDGIYFDPRDNTYHVGCPPTREAEIETSSDVIAHSFDEYINAFAPIKETSSDVVTEGFFAAGFGNLRSRIADYLGEKFTVSHVKKPMASSEMFDIKNSEIPDTIVKVEGTGTGVKITAKNGSDVERYGNNVPLSNAFNKLINIISNLFPGQVVTESAKVSPTGTGLTDKFDAEYYMSTHTFELVKNDSIGLTVHRDGQYWFSVDEMIAPLIRICNQKGYQTSDCCFGHIGISKYIEGNKFVDVSDQAGYSGTYIGFVGRYNFKNLPSGWRQSTYRSTYRNGIRTLLSYTNNLGQGTFDSWKILQYHADSLKGVMALYKYFERLPDLNGKSQPTKEGYHMGERSIEDFKFLLESAKEDDDDEEYEKDDEKEDDEKEELEEFDITSFGKDSSDVHNEYNEKEVETLNKLIAAENDAMNDYFEAGKNTNIEVLRRLYADIGAEERFHAEQLIYAKCVITGEKYEPRDPKVKEEYKELLEMGMDEDTALSTAFDKRSMAQDGDDEGDDLSEEQQDAEVLEYAVSQFVAAEELLQNIDIAKLPSMEHSIETFVEAYVFQEAIDNVAPGASSTATANNVQKKSGGPIKLLVKAFTTLIQFIRKLGQNLKMTIRRITTRMKRIHQFIKANGISGIFAKGVYLYFYNDKNCTYMNSALQYIDMCDRLTGIIANNVNMRGSWHSSNILPNGVNPITFGNFDKGLDMLRGVVLTKTKVIVTQDNQGKLAELFFGYTGTPANLATGESNNIFYKIKTISDATQTYLDKTEKFMGELQSAHDDPANAGRIEQYNQAIKSMTIIKNSIQKFIKALVHDNNEVIKLNNGILEETKQKTESESFAEKLKVKEEKAAKLAELISNQTYVELLTSKELTTWFRENISQFGENVKMMVVTPTEEHMGGLGYPTTNELDINTNVLQLIFEDSENDTIKVLKTRLINFTDIDSNLQAHLIEQDGMLIVTV